MSKRFKPNGGFRRRFHPYFTLWATLMWVALMGEFTLGNIVAGALVGLFVCLALPLPAMPTEGIVWRWGRICSLMWTWLLNLISASFKVAWLALRPAAPPKSAIVKVPMRVESELIFAFATTLYNLQPGGAVTDIDVANRLWTVHLLDAPDEAHIEREIAAIADFERRLIHTFERTV